MKYFIPMSMVGLALMIAGCNAPAGKGYDSPEAGADALIAAIDPTDPAKIAEVLGPEGPELLDSGDEVSDQAAVERFVSAYRERHQFVAVDATTRVLEIGDDNWPVPIPLVKTGRGWQWDTAAGADEVLSRRIGRNELSVIQACLAFVDAQQEYAAAGHGGAPGVYAGRVVSEPGTHNGLYWPTEPGETPSPLGEYAASAASDGYTSQGVQRSPFHGYYFKLLRRQGAHAPGGAKEYEVDARLANGFALVAWPASYRRSGVMTFMVSNLGVIFECDLGSNTEQVVSAMTAFDPTPMWTITDPAPADAPSE